MVEKHATGGASDIKKAKQGFQGIQDLGVSNVAYCETESGLIQAFMLSEFFTVSPVVFPFIYGVPTEQKFTLVGIKGKQKKATVGMSPKGLEGSGTANLTNALGGFGKVIDDMFGSEKRVYPLALYKTL